MKTMNLTLMLLLFAVLSFAQNVPAYVPTNGLVGWWPFNGNANDESGNGNNGTVNGATLTSDRFGNAGKAYSFDGVDDRIVIQDANSLDLGVSATFSFWAHLGQINYDTISSAFDARIIDKGSPGINDGYLIDFTHITDSNSAYIEYLCSPNSTRLRTILGNTTNLSNCLADYNNLNHYLVIFNNGNGSIYINGQLSLNYSTIIPSIQTNSNNLVFGYQTSGNQNTWLNGSLDDIGIWNRALDSTEIAALYNSNTNTATVVNNSASDVKIYPNPSNDHITIDAGNMNVMNGYSIRISNSLGQQMFQSAITQQQFYIDLSTWTGNGIYFVNIIDPTGNIIDVKKIVLQ